MIPQGMTIQDAVKEYEENKIIVTGNDGELKVEGIECICCHEPYQKEKMRYCPCDEGPVCESCCSRCFFKNEGDSCTW